MADLKRLFEEAENNLGYLNITFHVSGKGFIPIIQVLDEKDRIIGQSQRDFCSRDELTNLTTELLDLSSEHATVLINLKIGKPLEGSESRLHQ